ncbi:acyl carrier protein [Tistrella bauzanensis]
MADNQRPGAVSAIIDHIVRELAHSLDQPPASIDPDVLFVDMGADSLMLAEALQDINQCYRVSLPIGEIYESVNTIARVADYIHSHGQWQMVLGPEVPGQKVPGREAVEAPAPAPEMAPAPALAGAVSAEAGWSKTSSAASSI